MRQVISFNNKNWALPHIQTDDRLRLEAVENSTFGLSKLASVSTVQYSLDNGTTWANLTTSSNITLNAGEIAYLRGKITGNLSASNLTQFKMTGKIACKGNIMYLYNYETLPDTIAYEHAFHSLFKGCGSLMVVEDILNYVTTMQKECYNEMFSGCYNLIVAPKLPATTVFIGCYFGMFKNCTSLTTAPQLPATTLAGWCYDSMFSGCSRLTTAPELPATTLANNCYAYMFNGCSSLNYIKCLAVNGINQNVSTTNWVDGVAASGTFVKNANATWPTGASGIPNSWTVQNA